MHLPGIPKHQRKLGAKPSSIWMLRGAAARSSFDTS